MSIDVAWTDFKNFVLTRNTSIRYVETSTSYFLATTDSDFSLTCYIQKFVPPTQDQNEFESSYKKKKSSLITVNTTSTFQLNFYNNSKTIKTYLGKTIAINSFYVVNKKDELAWSTDSTILGDVANGNLLVSTGQGILSSAEALELLKQVVKKYEVYGIPGSTNPPLARPMAGVSRVSAPTKYADSTLAQLALTKWGSLASEEALYTRWGLSFTVTTGIISMAATTEKPLFLLLNATGNQKNAIFWQAILSAPTFAAPGTLGTVNGTHNVYNFYKNPTVTSNGTSLSIAGNRQTGPYQSTASTTAFKQPTISANGTLYDSYDIVCNSSPFPIDHDFTRWLEPADSLLVTVTQSASGNNCGFTLKFIEEYV